MLTTQQVLMLAATQVQDLVSDPTQRNNTLRRTLDELAAAVEGIQVAVAAPGCGTHCPAGRYVNQTCVDHGNGTIQPTQCHLCPSGTFQSEGNLASACLDCSPLCVLGQTWEAVPCTPTTDRVCNAVRTSAPGQEYELSSFSLTSSRVCAPLTQCNSSSYELVSPTAVSDRHCALCRVCGPVGQEWESSPCAVPPTANRGCAVVRSCSDGEREASPPTATSNRACESCPAGTAGTGGTCTGCSPGSTYQASTGQTTCSPCPTCPLGRSSPCTTTSPGTCVTTAWVSGSAIGYTPYALGGQCDGAAAGSCDGNRDGSAACNVNLLFDGSTSTRWSYRTGSCINYWFAIRFNTANTVAGIGIYLSSSDGSVGYQGLLVEGLVNNNWVAMYLNCGMYSTYERGYCGSVDGCTTSGCQTAASDYRRDQWMSFTFSAVSNVQAVRVTAGYTDQRGDSVVTIHEVRFLMA
eukprot:m.236273 g.236273  ORF g.236273 m.236273 type:complete len:464 (-) comp22488_c0_seq16:99-1490(-)